MHEHIKQSSPSEREWILEQLIKYNKQFLSVKKEEHIIPLNFNIKIKDIIVAGVNAVLVAKGSVFVSILWVDEEHRGNEYGSILLNHVENQAKKHGAKLIYLDTVDFQAPGFYHKHGYRKFGELEDYPVSGHKKFFMKKKL